MKIRRVVVRLDPVPRSGPVLEAAAALAEKLEAELVGLFVESTDLLYFAGLPFAREVGFPSATRRPLDVSAMERALRSHAKDAQERLARAAARSRAQWSFQVARARPSSPEPVLVAQADLVVVHLTHMSEFDSRPAVRVVRAGNAGDLRMAVESEPEGILVLAGNDDYLVSEALRRLSEGAGK